MSAPSIPGLLSLDPIGDPTSLLSSLTKGTEVEVQFGKSLQVSLELDISLHSDVLMYTSTLQVLQRRLSLWPWSKDVVGILWTQQLRVVVCG